MPLSGKKIKKHIPHSIRFLLHLVNDTLSHNGGLLIYIHAGSFTGAYSNYALWTQCKESLNIMNCPGYWGGGDVCLQLHGNIEVGHQSLHG